MLESNQQSFVPAVCKKKTEIMECSILCMISICINSQHFFWIGNDTPFRVFPEIHPFLGAEASHVDKLSDDVYHDDDDGDDDDYDDHDDHDDDHDDDDDKTCDL